MTQVRRATEHDLQAVADLDRRYSPVFTDQASYAGLLSGDTGLLMVATGVDGICGLAAWTAVADVAELINLAVSPRARSQGIGRRLMEASRDILLRRGVSRLVLDVRESNVAARALYVSMHFSVDGRRRAYYAARGPAPREDALLMSCNLGVNRADS